MPNRWESVRPPRRKDISASFSSSRYQNKIAFSYPTAIESAAAFLQPQEHYFYARAGHMDVDAFAACIAELEREGDPTKDITAIAVSSGVAAFNLIVDVLIPDTERKNEYIVSSSRIYGGIFHVMSERLPRKRRIYTVFVDQPNNLEAWETAIASCPKKPAFLHIEPVGNPLAELYDISVPISVGHSKDIPVVVDNTLTVVELRPFRFGADIVYYSTSKVPTAGEVLSGVIVGHRDFIAQCQEELIGIGACLGVRDAIYGRQRMRNLQARAKRHAANKRRLFAFLREHPAVDRIYFSDYGGLLSFEVSGGREAAWQILDALSASGTVPIITHFGESRTMVAHPASTTHSKMSFQDRERAGISEGLIRVWVGAESRGAFERAIIRAFAEALNGLLRSST